MLEYGSGGQEFSAMPRVVQGKHRFRDPYGTNAEEYYPQNIMFDKRIQRGNTYAAMVIPAGTSHDTMITEKRQTQKAQSMGRRTFKSTKTPERIVPVYPNRDIPSPEPVMGRQHLFVQTDEYIENLTDKPPTNEMGIATEFYLDRPPVPLFQPKMPHKDNCKATQIFDADYELFNFDEEVEPMLNVLCLKTLEQARMEVLEECELATMKQQKKEYEEVRNAELIEAQRFEAAEARVNAEKERRGNQQKARKTQRKLAHQKHVSRVVAKKYLIGIKDRAISTLASMSMLKPQLEQDIHQTVLPWLQNQKQAFACDKKDAIKISEQIIEEGILKRMSAHAKTLKARADKFQKETEDLAMAGVHQEERRAARKIARETRAKEQAKAKMRDEIRRLLIDKGQVAESSIEKELMEIHGCFINKQQYQGALGGQLQQLYYVVNAILKMYNDEKYLVEYHQKLSEDPKSEELKKYPKHPRELLLENFFLPFVITAIKELKCGEIKYLLTPEMDALVQTFKLPRTGSDNLDFTRLTNEQYLQFRHAFVEERMYNPTFKANKGHKAMDMILSAVCMVMCGRVPKNVVAFGTNNLASTIKLVNAPRGIEVADRIAIEKTAPTAENPKGGEQEVTIEKNTNEKAIVRIMVPKRTMTLSEVNVEEQKREEEEKEGASPEKEGEAAKDGEKAAAEKPTEPDAAAEDAKAKDEQPAAGAEAARSQQVDSRLSRVPSDERIIEQDQDGKALMIGSRINLAAPYMIYQMNQYAARVHRTDFLDQVKSKVLDFFMEKENIKVYNQLKELADDEAEAVDAAFIASTCDEYELPCLEYNVHAPDHE